MIAEREAAELCRALTEGSVEYWVVGGWGVDALLRRQTRDHKDLDLLVTADDLARFVQLLEEHGYALAYTWPETRWLDATGAGPTAFVMDDPDGRQVDVHVLAFGARGEPEPLWETERSLSSADLAGRGSIGGVPVRCTTAEMQLRDHATYAPSADQTRDVQLLQGLREPEE